MLYHEEYVGPDYGHDEFGAMFPLGAQYFGHRVIDLRDEDQLILSV